jgi:DNA-binding MarR family transcriptional regulator
MRRSQRPEATARRDDERRWSLLTAHAEVLFCIARNPDTRVREIASTVGISERGAHQIVADLVGAGYVRRARIGRRNHYAIESKTTLKHAPVRHRRLASIIALLEPEPAKAERAAKPRRPTRGRASATDSAIAKPAKRRAAA